MQSRKERDVKIEGEIKSSEALGRILQQGRLLQGLTQQELADELGISQAYIWQMESGHSTIYATRLFEMLRANGVRLKAEIEINGETPKPREKEKGGLKHGRTKG